MLVYEHNSSAGLYAGTETSACYRFETPDGLPVCFFSGVGVRVSFLFDISSSYNPSAFLLPVYGIIEEGVQIGDDIELVCSGGFGVVEYIDAGMALQSGFSFILGIGVKNYLSKKFFVYCSNRWAAALPAGSFHNNFIFSAGAGWRF
jgi:hypothetical protein